MARHHEQVDPVTGLPIEQISMLGAPAQEALLALNNAHARETSFLEPEKWRELVATAFSATSLSGAAAFLIAFDQDAEYDSANFNWFRERLPRFVYVDRIIVADSHRSRGIANRLYRNLYGLALNSGHEHIVCEVNLMPPNPGSDAFHASMGFSEVGRAVLKENGKTVRYLAKRLDDMAGEL